MPRATIPPAGAMSAILLLVASFHLYAQSLTVKITPVPTGTFSLALSTSFQVAPWTDTAFIAHSNIPALLDALNPHHIRVQVIDEAIPQTAPNQWDFTELDRQLQPILTSADHSPEVQLAAAPTFLYRSKTHFVTPGFIKGYARYCAGMVRHYNAPGSLHPIRYWGILNEPNYFHISPAEYVELYNAAVPAMLAVDPSIKLVALELGGEPSDERHYVPAFARGVRAPADVLGVHLYSTCDQREPDQVLFDTIPGFVTQIHYLQRVLPRLPIWILENNINADFVNDLGNSTCNPTQKFIKDIRGASSFYLVWRATEFAHFAQAGVKALYQWHFTGDMQYAEFNTEKTPAHLQLGYWLDLWLGKLFPADRPITILSVTNPDPARIAVLATRASDGTITILIANHTVRTPLDNNGVGAPRTLLLDVFALGNYKRAYQLTFDSSTNPLEGAAPIKIDSHRNIPLQLPGYGVSILTLAS